MFSFSLQCLSETVLILRVNEPDKGKGYRPGVAQRDPGS